MKKILVGVALLVVIGAIAVWYVISSLDAIVEAAIEHYGSEATGARVTVDAVEIELRAGEAGIRGITVGNPPGFTAPSAFELGNIRVALDPETATSNPLLVKEIRIEAPKVSYETGPRGSNLDAIQRNVEAFSARYAGDSAGAAAEPSDAPGAERTFIIENLIIRDGSVNARIGAEKDKVYETKLGAVHVKNIGKKRGGATGAEVTSEILDALIADASRSVAKMGLERLKKEKLSPEAAGALGAAQRLLGD
jgi:uncharacterized protein involved in outer membrane biogenesis